MHADPKTSGGPLLRLKARLRAAILARKHAPDEPPLRSELLTANQMEQHGKSLAARHQLDLKRGSDELLARLDENEDVLLGVRDLLVEAVTAERPITPAGEWLLDNFYLIEEQIRAARIHLPKGFSRELPCLLNSQSAGLPRTYDIALETISHGDGRVDPESLSSFIAAYQTVTALELGELWALPIMLRLALVENLRRVAAHMATDRSDRNHAQDWADQMIATAEKDPKSLILVIAEMARSNPPLVSSFVAELARRLQGQGPALALPLTWIEERLSESGATIKQLVEAENQRQAADQVSVSNSIGSLRFLGAMDWREFVETMSMVEQILREDIGGVYGRMDFSTRDRYRHVIEKVAKRSPLSESAVAREAIALARQHVASTNDYPRADHVGFYLVDRGLPQLLKKAEASSSGAEALRTASERFPLAIYIGSIAGITAVITAILLSKAHAVGVLHWPLALLGVVLILCASHLAVAMVNWLATLLATPYLLPRMDLSKGIPRELRTLVVVPTMLTSEASIGELVEALEVRFLANRDENLHFGLLTDFRDANQESLPEDGALLRLAQQKIAQLNEKYPGANSNTFFLFHRPRRWNPGERTWMGYERKRGKLGDLNALLRGRATDRFSLIVGATLVLANIRYVITLDTDTQLPRDSAWQLVGAMAHPLNRPCYDADQQRVVEGYGILQPRVSVSLPGTNRSRYARLYGSEPGIDPYTRAVSDVYQDLFHEGSFIGKGIYDVDAFEQALNWRFPENRILSHDLLEGCYARAGLLSDVQVYEEYPARYSADVSRRHRWIRGDWQILRWALPCVPGPGVRFRHNPLSGLSRWKIFDNLRRSLIPASLTLLLILGWTVLRAAGFWTMTVVAIVLLPSLFVSALDLLRKPVDVSFGQHVAASAHSAGMHFAQAALTLVCLPYEAFFTLDAILRTAARTWLTHRRRLEWNPSCADGVCKSTSMLAVSCTMWFAPVLSVMLVICLAEMRPSTLAFAGPLLAAWLISPGIAWWISRPLSPRGTRLSEEQTIFLRKLSRKTWRFFETFVGPLDHWLPPDNYQENPVAVVSHRTSPTNIGLALLASLAANDFCYLSTGLLLERIGSAMQTMGTMERYRGHFLNWYDTTSLKPLSPMYVSTVDSGNLAACLLTLRPGLLGLADARILGDRLFAGLSDTLGCMEDVLAGASAGQFAPLKTEVASLCASPPATLTTARLKLELLLSLVSKVVDAFDLNSSREARWWATAFASRCRAAIEELSFLAPWSVALPASDGGGFFAEIDRIPTLRELAASDDETFAFHGNLEVGVPASAMSVELRSHIAQGGQRARARIATIAALAEQCGELAHQDYDFLYDESRHLLAIGYNVGERRRDASYYDLLASEARLASFVGIAQGQLPQQSWFALGRLLTISGGEPTLLSWSGSMFEYLMPLLVMPTYRDTLLDKTYQAAVNGQIEYGRRHGVPWGISESGYNTTDVHLNYQYRAFGVPGQGLKRGLADDLVIAPYASALALMVAPEEACLNLQRLAAEGAEGQCGFYEAIDYTSSRLPRGRTSAMVRSFMAHHQGMSFLSLAYVLLDQPMQKRFESDPLFQATILLLQERVPRTTAFYTPAAESSSVHARASSVETPVRMFQNPNTLMPEVQLLSNGRYHVMVTNAGGGYSRWKDIAVTRWREDATCDDWGSFCFVRDVASGHTWSTAYQPTREPTEEYEAIFSEARAEFRCRNHDYVVHTEIAVSPEDDVEVRRITITNRSRRRRVVEVTSYSEVVLTSSIADAIHPAFSNLFVQTEIHRERGAILCTRRPRSQTEQAPWMFHLMAVHGADTGDVSYETDRMQFIGRGNTIADPQAMRGATLLSGSEGSVLDPIVAVRHQVTLGPGESATINIVTGMGETRDACLGLVDKYQDRRLADRVFDLAWTHSDVFLRQLNASEIDAQLYARLASSILYANPSLRADPSILIKNRRGQSGLWGYSISGDLPIVLLQIGDPDKIDLVRQLVQAHAYWRLKGLAVDLLIWNEDHAGYRQALQEQIMGLIAAGIEAIPPDRPGGIFVRYADQMSAEDRILLQSVARVTICDNQGTLADQVKRRLPPVPAMPRLAPTRTHLVEPATAALTRDDLIFFNGVGGFTPDGREYVITTTHEQETPAPWINVLANPRFGTVISESGSANTWAENAHEFRLTPWNNDPVSDVSGEAFYLRDEESGHVWSPTPLPMGGTAPYVTRHGFGYSVFEHSETGIRSELWLYVALEAPVKFAVLKVKNESGRSRKLSIAGYVEWVLGDLRPKTSMHLTTEIDPNSGALFARNPYNTEFAARVGFFAAEGFGQTVTCDRVEFLGRNGTMRRPAALSRVRLSGNVGAALDPCAAIQLPCDLAAGEEREIVFTLGMGQDAEEATRLVHSFCGTAAARSALEAVWQYWNHTLGAAQVETPDAALNTLTNGWLVYQTLACRLWGRSGYYQPGGAFGFRDQLQDVMALIHTQPQFVRAHLLLCASRQFPEGDVQHWWHPPDGRGVRTHCSDDYLWLPLATCRYVLMTGDSGVLDEPVHFIDGRLVSAEEDSYWDMPAQSPTVATLYEHCVRAILKSSPVGEHGLPLIGCGDWNDGMNLVGEHGKGESIWLGFFLYEVLMQFAKVARLRGESAFAGDCERRAEQMRRTIEQNGWDGAWYRRAYFDDGSPLGSATNEECQIDSIAQSWAVLSGAGDRERAHQAMEAVERRLVHYDTGLIQLLDPPFDKSSLNPGSIRGYVPGVRENGGQYTHAAVWAAMAFAALGDNRRAWELFDLINPINHAKSPEAIRRYKVEPYVIAADVYAVRPHTGRGGWTWYTGSAGWMYRLIIESILGVKLLVDRLYFAPCIPLDWTFFKLHYRYRETVYHITITRTSGVGNAARVSVDGVEQGDAAIQLINDGKEHKAEVSIPFEG